MTHHDLKLYAAEIECTLVVGFFPSFLNYIIEEDYIHFIISSNQFKNLKISDRISLIFQKLRLHDVCILNEVPIIIEAFTTNEIEDLIDYHLD